MARTGLSSYDARALISGMRRDLDIYYPDGEP